MSVNWKSKSARLEFDESLLPAQQLAQAIDTTPHMMGRKMRYAGWLALRVEGLRDKTTAKAVQDLLSEVEGVSKVATYPKQAVVAVKFTDEGNVTTEQLIEFLREAGHEANHY